MPKLFNKKCFKIPTIYIFQALKLGKHRFFNIDYEFYIKYLNYAS